MGASPPKRPERFVASGWDGLNRVRLFRREMLRESVYLLVAAAGRFQVRSPLACLPLAGHQGRGQESRIHITIHALEEMGEDDVLDEDIENVVLKGRIVERQLECATKERKYVLTGKDVGGEPVGVVLKMGSEGKAVVITVYREETKEP